MEKMKTLLMSICLLLVSAVSFAQVEEASGNVTDNSGEPVIGATVIVVGGQGNAGTVTDIDGNFTVQVQSGSKLSISFMGYKTQVVKAAKGLRIVLEEDAKLLNEVVVTGYTTQRKADLTGAISVVSVDEIAKQNENNPIKALQGRVPGMNITADGSPSGTATVRIRGIGTLNNNDPLYIVDGVPTKSGMHELNGNDIESIQVLKDAASASIYGSRAANGVIIITTKKGKEGKVKVDFDGSISVSTYAHKMDVLNAKEFGQVMWRAYMNDGMDPNTNGLGYSYDWSYNEQGNPVLNGISMKKYLDDAGTTPAADTDWFDETTRTGVVQQYNVSVSKGSDKGSSFFSLGYYKNLGIIKHSDFNRFSARMNTEYKHLKNNSLTVGEHFTVNRTSEVAAPGGFLQNVLQFNPSLPIYTEDGNYAGPVGGYPDRYNPVAVLERNKDNRYTYWRMFGDAYVNLNLFKGFNIRSTFGLDYSQKQQRFFTYPVTEGNVANDKNAVEAKQEHWTKWMWNAVATYNKEIGQHRFDLMAGMELNRQDDIYFSGYKEGFAVLNPDYMWPDAGTTGAQAYGGGSGYSLVSFFGKANYNYADKYMASFTIRRDGSSRFGKNNRYATFPSVSAGWRINQENFLKKASWIDDLKIRASWGQTGNQEIDNLARYTIFVSNYGVSENGGQSYGTSYDIAGTNGGSTLPSGFKRNQIGNDDIKWETTTQTDLGLDFAFFHSALTFTVDYFNKRTNGMLMTMNIPSYVGEAKPIGNVGDMRNRGVEFELGYKWHVADANFSIKGNASYLSNTLLEYGNESGYADLDSFQGIGTITRAENGHPFPFFYGYKTAGIFQTLDEVNSYVNAEGKPVQPNAQPGDVRFVDVNGDGLIDNNDRTDIGNGTPKWTYGINFNASWKGLDFNMFWQGVAGVDVFDATHRTDIASSNYPSWMLGRWTGPGTSNKIPRLFNGDANNWQSSDLYIFDGSYFRLKNITLGYTLPKSLTMKFMVERLRFYVSAENLLTFTKYHGFDPEIASGGTSLGVDYGVYPQARTWTVGFNITL